MSTETIARRLVQGGRRAMEEICVYEVTNDKIVREQFFYPTG